MIITNKLQSIKQQHIKLFSYRGLVFSILITISTSTIYIYIYTFIHLTQ